MISLVIKRSIVIDGQKTSVSLENEFWDGLRETQKRSAFDAGEADRRWPHYKQSVVCNPCIRLQLLLCAPQSEKLSG